MPRSSILIAVLGVVVAIAAVFFLVVYAPWAGPPSPAQLEREALQAPTPERRAQAAVRLAGHEQVAVERLRRTLQESDTPEVRAASIQGLGARYDYDSIESIFAALEDPSPLVRGRAGAALRTMLGADFGFRANDPPEAREQAIRVMRAAWEKMKNTPMLEDWKRRLAEGG